ncbi:MAG: DUF971 domain-containing protein [Oleiphilaceae bacterium]|nr:DUF971 domain-containing protein [Oleiphilaceae bacterium]
MSEQTTPKQIKLRQASACLELHYDNECFDLSAEFLRVHSPSAEVQGHGNPILQTGKQHVRIDAIEGVGNYGIKLVFSDGHDTGIYTWSLLRKFCLERDELWQAYLDRLNRAGASRTS